MSVLHYVQKKRPGRKFLDTARGFLLGFEALEKTDVGANLPGGFQAGDALVVPELLVCVCAGDEDDVGFGVVYGCAGGADAREVDVCCYNLFAGEVAAAFGEDLVFNVEGGDVGADVLIDGLGYCYGTCVGWIRVCDDDGYGRLGKV